MAGTSGSIDIPDGSVDIGEVIVEVISEILVCADGEPAIRRVNRVDGVDTIIYIGEDDVDLGEPTSWVPGGCCDCPDEPITVTPRFTRVAGVTPFSVPANTRSITLTILQGSVSVDDGLGSPGDVPAGISLSWGVDDTADENLTTAMDFTGSVDSVYFVTWTNKP